MKKIKIGKIKNKTIIHGDINYLLPNEILVTLDEGYTILREKVNGKINTSVIIPLKEFYKTNDASN